MLLSQAFDGDASLMKLSTKSTCSSLKRSMELDKNVNRSHTHLVDCTSFSFHVSIDKQFTKRKE